MTAMQAVKMAIPTTMPIACGTLRPSARRAEPYVQAVVLMPVMTQ